MNFCQARVRLVQSGVVLAAAALVAGCGNNYRPSVTPINSPGPASQPQSYAVAVSAPSTTTPGIATVIDYAGDSIMATAAIGIGPITFAVSSNGYNGFTINRDGTLTYFPISSFLQQNQILYTTLPSTAQPVNLFAPSSGLWAADLCATDPTTASCPWDNNPLLLNYSGVDVFNGSPATLGPQIPLAPTPVMVLGVGSGNSGRMFAISQGNSSGLPGSNVTSGVACNSSPTTAPLGEADGIEVGNNTISSRLALGKCPVYAVLSTDTRRLFVLNRGSDTITVINTQNDTLDTCSGLINENGQPVTCHPTLPLSTSAITATGIIPPNCNHTTDPTCGGMPATAGPVYAEYNSATNQLIVANYDGGTISVIDASLDEYSNDSATFGTTFTIPVGNYPASVTVLWDGSRAYTANQADQTVSIVNLSSHTVEKTLPITGNPRTVVSTQNSTKGKVYVASPNSNVLTIIRTDQDIVDTTLLLQGKAVDVRVSSQNGTGATSNFVSRTPGYGQPCNLPGNASTASLAACQALP